MANGPPSEKFAPLAQIPGYATAPWTEKNSIHIFRVIIREGERVDRHGLPSFRDAVRGSFREFRTYFLHCFIIKLINFRVISHEVGLVIC